jgi:hypothetical protein
VTASTYVLRKTSSSPQPVDLRIRWLRATRRGNRHLALVKLEWRLVQALAIAFGETDGVAA